LDILQVLFEHGSDVNERVGFSSGGLRKKKKKKKKKGLKASDTPLMVAVNNAQSEAAGWFARARG